MKLYYKAIILLLICTATACGKKKRSEPQKQSEKPSQLNSITETYDGQSTTYLLSYTSANKLKSYQKQGDSEKFNYTYEGNRINSITYDSNGKAYGMILTYSAEGKVTSGMFTAGTPGVNDASTLDLTCTQNGDETLIKAYDGLFTLTVKNDNLLSAEFSSWYYKRKITFTYGTEPGILYGTNCYLPNAEITNPFTPQSQVMRIVTQMALQVFSKNNLTGVRSSMYNRTINYAKDGNGNVVNSFTKIDRMDGDVVTATSQKQIVYSYQ